MYNQTFLRYWCLLTKDLMLETFSDRAFAATFVTSLGREVYNIRPYFIQEIGNRKNTFFSNVALLFRLIEQIHCDVKMCVALSETFSVLKS